MIKRQFRSALTIFELGNLGTLLYAKPSIIIFEASHRIASPQIAQPHIWICFETDFQPKFHPFYQRGIGPSVVQSTANKFVEICPLWLTIKMPLVLRSFNVCTINLFPFIVGMCNGQRVSVRYETIKDDPINNNLFNLCTHQPQATAETKQLT